LLLEGDHSAAQFVSNRPALILLPDVLIDNDPGAVMENVGQSLRRGAEDGTRRRVRSPEYSAPRFL